MQNSRNNLHNSLKTFFKVDKFMDYVEELHKNDTSKGLKHKNTI